MRFIDVLRPEGAREERAPRHIRRPGFAQSARECEQDRARRERRKLVEVAQEVVDAATFTQ